MAARLDRTVSEQLERLPSKSAKIRFLDRQGMARGDIARMLGVRYQAVHNVLGPKRKGPVSPERTSRGEVELCVRVDPLLLQSVDAYVVDHPESDRSRIVNEALKLWVACQQDRAMEEQFRESESAKEQPERNLWRRIRAAAASRRFGR